MPAHFLGSYWGLTLLSWAPIPQAAPPQSLLLAPRTGPQCPVRADLERPASLPPSAFTQCSSSHLLRVLTDLQSWSTGLSSGGRSRLCALSAGGEEGPDHLARSQPPCVLHLQAQSRGLLCSSLPSNTVTAGQSTCPSQAPTVPTALPARPPLPHQQCVDTQVVSQIPQRTRKGSEVKAAYSLPPVLTVPTPLRCAPTDRHLQAPSRGSSFSLPICGPLPHLIHFSAAAPSTSRVCWESVQIKLGSQSAELVTTPRDLPVCDELLLAELALLQVEGGSLYSFRVLQHWALMP